MVRHLFREVSKREKNFRRKGGRNQRKGHGRARAEFIKKKIGESHWKVAGRRKETPTSGKKKFPGEEYLLGGTKRTSRVYLHPGGSKKRGGEKTKLEKGKGWLDRNADRLHREREETCIGTAKAPQVRPRPKDKKSKSRGMRNTGGSKFK